MTRFGAKRRHGLTRLRGRDVELALLHEHWNVVRDGRFRPVNVIGDAGLGKSRLIFEFTELLHDHPSFCWRRSAGRKPPACCSSR